MEVRKLCISNAAGQVAEQLDDSDVSLMKC